MTKSFLIILAYTFSFLLVKGSDATNNEYANNSLVNSQLIYDAIQGSKPSFEVFYKGITGFYNLKLDKEVSKDVLTIIDFSLSSTEKRLWVIDLNQKRVLFYDYVAHGRNSGDEFASAFSNMPKSYMSSLGFYVTGDTYIGKHGLSLYLEGLEKGFNDKARERAVVMHGANYADPNFIHDNGRLGRSLGCPALPPTSCKQIIEELAGGSCLFIYFPDENYLKKSALLKFSNPHLISAL